MVNPKVGLDEYRDMGGSIRALVELVEKETGLSGLHTHFLNLIRSKRGNEHRQQNDPLHLEDEFQFQEELAERCPCNSRRLVGPLGSRSCRLGDHSLGEQRLDERVVCSRWRLVQLKPGVGTSERVRVSLGANACS